MHILALGTPSFGIFSLLTLALYFGVVIFLITLASRATQALEGASRHLLEIARDLKEIAASRRGD